MSFNRRVLVVGALPNPIGGVTSFIYRLASENYINKIADLQSSNVKFIPKSFKGQVLYFKGVLEFIVSYLLSSRLKKDVTDVHFNFSTTRSLLIFGLIPFKGNRTFHLTLHHGILKSHFPLFFEKVLLSRVDVIYSLSNEQFGFYKQFGKCVEEKVIPSSSYVPLAPLDNSDYSLSKVDEFLTGEKLVICSGYCTKLYNHDWVIKLINEVATDSQLLVFLYGNIDDEYLMTLKYYSKFSKRVKLIFNASQDSFNFYLSKAALYIRPTEIDSFGIAVADAVNFGVKVLASDVCKRYPGAYLFTPSNYDSLVNAYRLLTSEPGKLEVECGSSRIFEYSFINKSNT
ncbi:MULTISPECIES: glycosyltransferase [Idiomarina]|jgi:hypothetical protein|uniref:glycosyltransferase n=1 Tax=Idiomarina TaxID=135575 RepID=UPI000C60F21E|nr:MULTISPECIES: glycosyltransferase [Idiomarina]MAO68553.1 hypothetical protein [Idiomarina sp.]MBF81298.1 hypothetical protein [Idiomarina sp.]|tara:strand:+ start:12770 stop:13798 length:1029 start_codon:yes stop_codon:yes gene_type:complete